MQNCQMYIYINILYNEAVIHMYGFTCLIFYNLVHYDLYFHNHTRKTSVTQFKVNERKGRGKKQSNRMLSH